MTELTFLVDLLLTHKLPKLTRDAVAGRIKEVEEKLATASPRTSVAMLPNPTNLPLPPHMVGQSASTIAAMLKHEQAGHTTPVPPVQSAVETPPVAVVAQTPATAAALSDRQTAISLAISGKPAKGETRPRKW